ncbi:hypothetical protein IJL65_02940 [bacterium]|nr:hypothetical protein [bacterium]
MVNGETKWQKESMKKTLFIAFVAIATIAAMASCTTDPVHNGDPVDTSFSTGFPLDQFRELGQAGDTLAQRQLVDQYRRQLTINVVNHYPDIQDENNIKFILGSGYAKDVLTGSGKTHSGKFKNELIIVIDDPNVKETLFLACGNGMLRPLKYYDSYDLGSAEQWRFTIKEGESLATYIPTLTEWGKTAEDLGIPIKNKDGKVVSSDTYLNYLGKWESLLFTGDVIDLIAGKVYNKSGQEVDFARRMAETEKANAEAAKAKKRRRR